MDDGVSKVPFVTMGRIVFYRDHNGVVSPAVVREVLDENLVSLAVFSNTQKGNILHVEEVPYLYDDALKNEVWFYPPRYV